MGFSRQGLKRLEEHGRGRCPECGLPPDGPGGIALVDDGVPGEGFPDDPAERCGRCGRCGRPLWCVIQIVYDSAGDEEWGGGLSYGTL